jgi:RHS repeat-associated protein
VGVGVRRSGLLGRLGGRVRRVATGSGVLALAVPLAWPSGVAGQHVDVPSAGSVRSGVVRLADWMTGDSAPATTTPAQQSGTAAGAKHLVPASATKGLKHVTGHAPGTGKGQLPLWAAHGPGGSASGTFTARPAERGFDAATSKLVASATTAQSDLYQNADGSYTRKTWSTPVNYRTASGSWAPIDDTLAHGSAGRWQEKANSLAVSFAASGSDAALSTLAIPGGSQQVSFSLAGAGNVAASASGSSVTYPGILPDTDVTETATPEGIKESLTLDSTAAGTSWTFPLTLNGLTPSLDNGSVDLTDSAGNLAAVIPPAVATSGPVNLADPDSQASSQLTYQLVTQNGAPALEMSLDPSWLDAPGRAFPVIVDPTVSTAVPQGSDYAQSANGTAQTASNNNATFDPSGTTTTSGTIYDDVDFLDYSELGGNYANDHITSASLNLFDAYAAQCTASASVTAYQVTGSWSPNNPMTYPGPAYTTQDAQWTGTAPAHACANTTGLAGKGGWLSLPMNSAGLNLINQWTAGSAGNMGFAVQTSLSNASMFKQFDGSADGNVASTQGGDCTGDCRPYVSVTYSTTASDQAPVISSQFPPDNYNAPTLTPELIASGSDPDSWPFASVQYNFTVYKTSDGSQVATSGNISSGDWTVPAGDLLWGQSYYWTVQTYDGDLYSSSSPQKYYLTTAVPQPLVTSQLSQNPAGAGYNPQTGNWTTSATDAQVQTAGPALEITRDYNSSDPRTSGAFGTGWSSVLDMKVTTGQYLSPTVPATQIVTYPDGEQVGFGLNHDGTSYSPPPGRYATLVPVAGGGFTLIDKNDTVYKFTQVLSPGLNGGVYGEAYGINSITDALGRTESFTYNGSGKITSVTSASARSLAINWTTPSGATSPHVASVVTPDASAGNASTAQTWTYQYSGDDLSAACPPASTTACTAYTYTTGSDYPESVLDSGPQSYWRLDETSGTAAASSVLANEGADNAFYSGTTLGTDTGPLAGSPAKAATFNGSSYAALPSYLVSAASYQTISLWFKTTATNGVLWSSTASTAPTGTTNGSYSPELYVGTSGKLNGAFWDGNASDVMTSTSAVNDGKWHNAVLTDTNSGQQLYLDGVPVKNPLSKGFASHAQVNNFVGSGYLGGGWPDETHQSTTNNTGYASGFNGDISDAAIWTRQLTPAEVQAMYAAGTHQAALLNKVTQPSSKVAAQVSYDPLTSRVTTDTDGNGGKWQVSQPTVQGSSQGWVGSVLGARPSDYWRLNDTASSQAADYANDCQCSGPASYYNVTEGVSGGPFADQTVAAFNGTSSYLDVPVADTASAGPGTVGVWFKTTGSNEVLYSEQGSPVTGPAPSSTYDPVLYVGNDGKLNGEFWDGNATDAVSKAAVNDGKWHYAVLAAGSSSQSLYVDGALQATISGSVSTEAWKYAAAGAGFAGGPWPDLASSTMANRWFTGDLAELAWYPGQLSAAQVTTQWNTVQNATGLTPVQADNVTDPGGNTLSWTYDLLNGGRELSSVNAEGGTTSYTYDTNGFQASVTDPDGDVTQTGHDVRGNMTSQTTCQKQSTNQCSTSYWTYYPDDQQAAPKADARNDMALTYADGRSASNSDTTYQTKYTYNSAGELTGETTPSGRTTSYLYTDGTTSAGGYTTSGGGCISGVPPQAAIPPPGLPYRVTTPGGAVTTTLYYANGDVAQVTNPDGQQTVYTYDGLGRKASQLVCSDSYPNGLTTTYAYDANGDLVTQTDPAVTDRVTGAVHTAQTTTAYDADGDVTSQTVTDLTGGDSPRTVTSTYNGYDQLASQTDAAGAKTTYTYDAFGNRASQTDPDGNVTQYTYNGDGHLLTTTLANYTGSPSGSQQAAPLVEESRSYDPAGRLAGVTDAMGRITLYYYTDNGLLAGVQEFSPDWSKMFTSQWNSYDGAGNLVERWTNSGLTDTTYTVDADGRTTQQATDPNGLDRTTTTTYTPDDQQASVTQSGPDGVSQATSYTYDPAGNVLSQSVTDPGSGGPAAWFKLTQASGTAVADSVSGGQPATASGVTWDGSEGTFSGTPGTQVTTAGPVADTTGSFTVAGWVKLAAGGTGSTQAVASQAAGTASGFTLGYDSGSGDWQFARPLSDTASPSVAVARSSAPAAAGAWTFLAGTYDANTGTMTLYVNGTASGTATDTSPIPAHGAFTIGSAQAGGTQGSWLNGQAHDVQAYPRALSAAQLSQLQASGGDITAGTLTTTWTRDQRGLPTSMTSPDGSVTSYSYDQAGQLAVTTDPPVTAQAYNAPVVTARPVTMTGYNTFGDVTETEDANGDVTTSGYDADSRQVSKTLPAYTPPGGSPITSVSTTVYDGDGLVTSATDGLGNVTRYGYDQLGDQVTETAPDGSVTTTAYDTDGEPLSVTGPTGAQTQATYDYLGRKLTATQVERYTGSGTAAYTTSYFYNDPDDPWLSQVTSPDGVSTQYSYDPAGEQTAVTDGASNTTNYAYNSLGEQTKVTYPDGTATASGYDGAGNVTSTTSLSASGTTLSATTAAYNGEGNQVSATDAAGNSTTFTYDPTGLITQETQPVSATSGITTSFGYDAAGNQTLYTDGNGSQWQDTYNSWGLQESRIEPYTSAYTTAATSTFTTAYDADQNPVTLSEPDGVTVYDTYNKVGELTGQAGDGAAAPTPTRTLGYDTAGNLTSASTSNTAGSGSNATSEAFTYNDRGQVLTASGTAGATSYAYNGDGQATSVADAAGTTSYTYDGDGRLATLADPLTGTTATYSYNSDSQVSGISYGSGNDSQSFGYDGMRRLTTDTLKTSSGTTVASTAYGYSPDSQITSENTAGLAGATSNSYTYDEAGRLASWNNGTTTTAYGYDNNGNLTRDGAKTYTYDARDELTSDGTGSYTYAARGTPLTEPGTSGPLPVTTDAYSDLAAAGTSSYTYDALGRTVTDAPAAGSAYQFSYVGSSGTIASDGTSAYAWNPAGTVLAATGTPGGGTGGSLALTDTHGNQVGQFTASGTSLSGSRAYDPWGNTAATSGAMTGLLGYQSAWSDAATGKDLMGARWYDPAAGDFTSADTIQVSPVPDIAGGNPFAYAADAPLDYTDPTGHMFMAPAGDPNGQADQTYITVETSAAYRGCGACAQKAAAIAVADQPMQHASIRREVEQYDANLLATERRDNRIHEHRIWRRAQAAKKAARAREQAAPKARAADRPDPNIVGTAIGIGKGLLSMVDGAVNLLPDQIAQEGSHPRAPLWHADLAGGFASWADRQVGITPGSAGSAVQNATSIGTQVGSLFIPGVDDADAAAITAEISDGASVSSKAAEAAAGACLGGSSFTPATPVLLASGKTVPISDLKTGDKILASDTKTGKDQPETVTAVLVHHDTNLYDLTVKAGRRTEIIHTTANHLLWAPLLHQWIPAKQLKKGEHLKSPDGTTVTVVGGTTPADRDGWMWDLTVPGNNDHDFYVVSAEGSGHRLHHADAVAVLVHNSSCISSADILNDPKALEGLTPSQIDDLGRNAGFDVQPGSASAANPATRYYLPGTNRSVGFRVLPNGVAGQSGIKAGAYLRFFGGQLAGIRVPLASP